MRDIVGSIPKDSVYFGGTDPGRFAITLGSLSHEKANPFFTITQNALADAGYLQYLRELYGKRIYTPSVEDNKAAFSEYYSSARKRLMNGTLQPGEDVRLIFNFQCTNSACRATFPSTVGRGAGPQLKQLERAGSLPCQRCSTPMPIPEPQVSVKGTTAVMTINALLAKTIFEKNPDHNFYLEESFALDWMKPHMVPHGLIFKLERKPLKELLPEHIAQSRKDWWKYMALCAGDAVVKPETTVAELCKWVETIYIKGNHGEFKGDALYLKRKTQIMEKPPLQKGPPFWEQKAFSKLRVAQANLFAWRESATQEAKLKIKYAKEADFAYRQAIALGPIHPGSVFNYSSYLSKAKRFKDAKLILRTCGKIEDNGIDVSSRQFLEGILYAEANYWYGEKDYKQVISAYEELLELSPARKDFLQMEIDRLRDLQ